MSFDTNWLRWPFERHSREFRVYVVEPKAYDASTHRRVFDSVIRNFFQPDDDDLVSNEDLPTIPQPVQTDLIVFPEAFLCAGDLVSAMKGFLTYPFRCCVHVGLRPSYSASTHLFNLDELRALRDEIQAIGKTSHTDLQAFNHWLSKQNNGYYNLGCLFLVDANGCLRVCLHPKAVRAAVEFSAHSEEHMTEGNLLSLVTLAPSNKRFMAVTIQPLLCSDVLKLPRDTMEPNPLKAFSDTSAAGFPELQTDHIDLVSVSLCTPVTSSRATPEGRRRWRHEFEAAFIDAAKADDCFRHHFASFVLANFGAIGNSDAGLSGAFLPVPAPAISYPVNVSVWAYGKSGNESGSTWMCRTSNDDEAPEAGSPRVDNSSSAHLVCIDDQADGTSTQAKAMGFTFSRLVRDNPVGGKHMGLTKLEIRCL